MELIDTSPDILVQEPEFNRLLGYPRKHLLEGRALELAAWARTWYAEHGRPWIYARQTEGIELAGERIKVNGVEFSSPHLHDQFKAAQAHSAVLVAVSAGRECEEQARELWQAGKPDEYFFLEMYGSAVVEHLVTVASGHLCGWADAHGMVALPHYSPGYSGWDIADQIILWQLIRQGRTGLPGPLEVLDSGMLRPKKSLLAFVGLTRHLDKVQSSKNLVPCESCSLPRCQYRRAPYIHPLPQIEAGHWLKPGRGEDSNAANGEMPRLTPEAKYSLNLRALRKWSQDRLKLVVLRDGSVEARFRYEGTTCSNMGRPLEYEYLLRLGSANDGYQILEANCSPAPGDTGHASQCEFLNDAGAFMQSVSMEKPLLGRPLNDVLAWERPVNPVGCYCDADGRAHKWGLVLEVIHYALVQREKGAHPYTATPVG